VENIFLEISLVLIVGTACAATAKFLRQPMIPAYIVAGIILGPLVLNIIKSGELLEALSTFGIAFLLFLVGIELDLKNFLKAGKIAILVGVLQMLLAIIFGYVVVRLLGFNSTSALLLAIGLGFSSTIVGLKLIGEKKELDTLYGQLVIGILLTQDFIAVLILIFFNVFSFTGDSSLLFFLGVALLKGILLFGTAFLAARFLLKPLFTYFARSSELLFLGAICWCLILALVARKLNFSIEVGSLLAGVSLSFLPYNFEISYRIKSLRDFFLPIFFAVLGGQLIFNGIFNIIWPTIILSVLVLVVSPVVVALLLLAFGYRSRTSFQSAVAIGQVSEFSFIIMALAYSVKLIPQETVSLVALIGLVTMTLSTYMIEYDDKLYALVRPVLKKIQKKKLKIADQASVMMKDHIIIFGYHNMGMRVAELLKKDKQKIIVVDNNPDKMLSLTSRGFAHLYGSMGDDEVLEKANITKAKIVISTVHARRDTLGLLEHVRKLKVSAKIIVTAFYAEDALEYYNLGAHYVIIPEAVSADYLVEVVKENTAQAKKKHLAHLKQFCL